MSLVIVNTPVPLKTDVDGIESLGISSPIL
jgi:hypothetical protein